MLSILKGVAVLLITVFLFGLSQYVKAADLDGATLQQTGICLYGDTELPCAVIQKDGTKYMLYAYDGQVVMVFRIKDGATLPYEDEDMTLIWKKGQET